MSKSSIEEISKKIAYCHQTPWRLNGTFLSRAMSDGDTMRQIIHRNMVEKYNIMKSLVSFYETHDREQLLKEIKKADERNSTILFSVKENQDCDYELGQPSQEAFEQMVRIAKVSQNNPELFKSCRYATDAEFFEHYFGSFFKKDEQRNCYYIDENVLVTIKKSEVTLYDGSRRESNWLNPEKYDEPHTMKVEDYMVSAHSSVFKKFENARVIDVLNETLTGQKEYLYFYPRTENRELNKLCRELIDDEEFSAPKYFKALTLLNADMEKSLQDSAEIKSGEINAAALLLDKAPHYFDKIDYVEQYNLYKSAGFREILKFSYLTTFTRQQEFDAKHMNGYLEAVANAGHWMRAQNIITRTITQNSREFGGINGQILDLNLIKPRPTKFHGMESEHWVPVANQYYDRDLERMKYIQLYLGKDKE